VREKHTEGALSSKIPSFWNKHESGLQKPEMAEAAQIYDVVSGRNTVEDVNDWAKIRYLVCSVKLLRQKLAPV
jgi:hypothetical protein